MTKTATISPAAARQQRYRDRRREGERAYRVVLAASEVEALIAGGWVKARAANNPDRVGEGVARMVRKLAKSSVK